MLIKTKPNTARMYLEPCQDITQDSDRPFLISYFIKWYTHFEFEKLTHGFMSQSQNKMLMLSLKQSIFFHFLKFLISIFVFLKLWFCFSFLPSLSIRVCAPLSPDGDLIVFAKRSDATCLLQVTGIIFIVDVIINMGVCRTCKEEFVSFM